MKYDFAESIGVAEVNTTYAVLLHEFHTLRARLRIHESALRVDAADVDDKVIIPIVLFYALDGADFRMNLVPIVTASDNGASPVHGNRPVPEARMV